MIASPFPSVWHTLAGGHSNHIYDDDYYTNHNYDDYCYANNKDDADDYYANNDDEDDDDDDLADDATALDLPTIKQVKIICERWKSHFCFIFDFQANQISWDVS